MNSRQFFTMIFQLGIRQKVMLILLFVLLSALTVSGWLALQQEKENTLKEINQRGSDISRFVAKSLAYSVVGYDYHTVQLLLDEITLSEEIRYARVKSKKGSIMAEAGEDPQQEDDKLVLFYQDIKLEDEVVGQLALGLGTEHTIKRLESQKYSLFKREAFIILLIAFGEFLALSIIIIRPVSAISKSLNNGIDENGKIVAVIPVTSNDEFGKLAAVFNTLCSQLNAANERLQSKIQIADKELIKTNRQLTKQSEELMMFSENLQRIAVTDELTGLFNRRRFEEIMRNEIDVSNRYDDCNSILILDIDHFKKINDQYGHPCGDFVIKEIAGLLRSNVRKTDILCRIGGEEFVALCRRADKQAAMQIAENLRKLIERTVIRYGEHEIRITVSIGISTIASNSTELDRNNMYRHADIALYRSKDTGRNLSTHYEDLDINRPRLESAQ